MRSATRLFERLAQRDELEQSALAYARGKRSRPEVARFLFERDMELARLHEELASGGYRHGGFRRLYLRDPKPRIIARASVRDCVVHTAIARRIEPAVMRRAMPEDIACRSGGGQHVALLRLLELVRRFAFCVHLDVRAYFASVDLEVLRRQLARRVSDGRFLALVDRVLESGRGFYDTERGRRHARFASMWPPPGQGLPMGALTSQLFACHVYLQDFDHWIKRARKVPGYVRYVDDLFLFGSTRSELRKLRAAVADQLWAKLKLRLKAPNARVLSCRGHVDALGFRLRRSGLDVLPRAKRGLRRRVAEAALHPVDSEKLERQLASLIGHRLFGT